MAARKPRTRTPKAADRGRHAAVPVTKRTAPRAPAAAPLPPCPVVGIGASAGGLAAFEAFFAGMPVDHPPAMAFVLVQHLAPDHKSGLTEIIRRRTRLEVFEVEDAMEVRPGRAYIIPPNRDLKLADGRLWLFEPGAPRGPRSPIDSFFRSLADDRHEGAIGIVLSGTGSDGAEGVRAIKAAGGLALAQTPETAEYEGMPRAAIATGEIDDVLPPQQMPARLVALVAAEHSARLPAAPSASAQSAWRSIFALLAAHTGHDFSEYKQNTIARRVERRMALLRLADVEAYAKYLRARAPEVEALFHELLIGVTSFFRDKEAFAALESQVIPRLFDELPAGATLRVWVPGCSTGEEAYSLAMLLREHADRMERPARFLVFATDIDARAIELARAGVFTAAIAGDVTPGRLARFFTGATDEGGYRVRKDLRDALVFSVQDVNKDPPFSRLDLVSCRNLMIYLGGELQKRLIPLFHYALRPGGCLFLGTSETPGDADDLFQTVDAKAKIYRRKPDAHRGTRPAVGGFAARKPAPDEGARPARPHTPAVGLELRQLVEGALLAEHGAVGALVDAHGEILFLHGNWGDWLEPAPGEASFNILTMAREGLRKELTRALHGAVTGRATVRRPGMRVRTSAGYRSVDLALRPVSPPRAHAGGEALLLVTLRPTTEPPPPRKAARPNDGRRVSALDLRAELAALKDELRNQEHSLSAANDALRSTNEELQSVNEELQSTNEELETSKEELQSVNEELATVNAELTTKVADLSRANNDMTNLLAGTGIGTIFVDHKLRIMRFTPTVTQVINLIPSDVGRPVGDIVVNLVGYDRLADDVRAVLDTLVPVELEVQTRSGSWQLLRIRPYRTQDNVIEGVVITFTDITELRQARELLRESAAERRLAAVVVDSYDAVTLQDLDGRVLAWNPAAERLYGWTAGEAIGKNIRELVPESHRADEVAELGRLSEATPMVAYRSERIAKDGRHLPVSLTATALRDSRTGRVYALATTEREADG